MTYPPELQAYYDAHDAMMDAERLGYDAIWPGYYGYYKVARYNAVKAGYLLETPEFG
jgi:hypothetical protein